MLMIGEILKTKHLSKTGGLNDTGGTDWLIFFKTLILGKPVTSYSWQESILNGISQTTEFKSLYLAWSLFWKKLTRLFLKIVWTLKPVLIWKYAKEEEFNTLKTMYSNKTEWSGNSKEYAT